ncbi:hypothetical protein ['Prunus avium' virescence phytoplasma]
MKQYDTKNELKKYSLNDFLKEYIEFKNNSEYKRDLKEQIKECSPNDVSKKFVLKQCINLTRTNLKEKIKKYDFSIIKKILEIVLDTSNEDILDFVYNEKIMLIIEIFTNYIKTYLKIMIMMK